MTTSFDELKGKALMDAYEFIKIGSITAPDSMSFFINIELNEALLWEKSIYIFMFNNEIVRIGSSKGLLGKRMKQWSRDVTNALHKSNGLESKHSNTPIDEALGWKKLLKENVTGEIYARIAHNVTTPIGTFQTYMDEESVLISRHKPIMNRGTNR